MGKEFQSLLSKALVLYKNEPWTEYLTLKSLTPLFGTEQLKALAEKHEETLSSRENTVIGDKETYTFLLRQLELINELLGTQDAMISFIKESKLTDKASN
jgi:hypothetical protein